MQIRLKIRAWPQIGATIGLVPLKHNSRDSCDSLLFTEFQCIIFPRLFSHLCFSHLNLGGILQRRVQVFVYFIATAVLQ